MKKPQFSFWTLIAACNGLALVIAAAVKTGQQPGAFFLVVMLISFAAAMIGSCLFSFAVLAAISIWFSSDSGNLRNANLRICRTLALAGTAFASPALLLAAIVIARTFWTSGQFYSG